MKQETNQSLSLLPFILLQALLTLPLSWCYQMRHMDEPGNAERFVLQMVGGPESLAFDHLGHGPYTGVSGGLILMWQGQLRGWARFAVNSANRTRECDDSYNEFMECVCGRPLGLQFHKATGVLYVADAYRGLLAVRPGGGVARLVASGADYGGPFAFTNGVDVDQRTGVVYFTDSSTVYQRPDYVMAVITGDSTGRLIKYDPRTNKLTVLKYGLPFPNGVAVSSDASFLLFAETGNCRVIKYWLRGPGAGATEVFAELPGYPDNIRRTPRGEYWVALNREKIDVKSTSSTPRWKMNGVQVEWKHAVAIRLSEQGEVVEVLNGGQLDSVSEVVENGALWIGSVDMPYIQVYKL